MGKKRVNKIKKKKVKREDKKIVIVQLENLLGYISHLKQLPHHNKDYKPWDDEVRKFLIDTFGDTAKEYMRYEGLRLAKSVNNVPEEQQQAYIDWLNQRETALKSIIEEHKISRYQKVGQFFDHLWQVTVKNTVEGITDGLKKP
jgi:hypothetical protein